MLALALHGYLEGHELAALGVVGQRLALKHGGGGAHLGAHTVANVGEHARGLLEIARVDANVVAVLVHLATEAVKLGLHCCRAKALNDLGGAAGALGQRHAHHLAHLGVNALESGHTCAPVDLGHIAEIRAQVIGAFDSGPVRLVAGAGERKAVHHRGIANAEAQSAQRNAQEVTSLTRAQPTEQLRQNAGLLQNGALAAGRGNAVQPVVDLLHRQPGARLGEQSLGDVAQVALLFVETPHLVAAVIGRARQSLCSQLLTNAELNVDISGDQTLLAQIDDLADLGAACLVEQGRQNLDHGVAFGRRLELGEELNKARELHMRIPLCEPPSCYENHTPMLIKKATAQRTKSCQTWKPIAVSSPRRSHRYVIGKE